MAVESLVAYARHRKERGLPGATYQAVQRAVKDGRLVRSVVRVRGRPKIRSFAAADKEWAENTDETRLPPAEPDADTADDGDTEVPALAVSRARKEAAAAQLAELELAKKREELVPAEEVEARWSAEVVAFRTAMLGIHVDCKQEMPELTLEQVARIEGIVRRRLEVLAGGPPG
jgi:phage terminase Nu1 subunit (DNA packaging protein)